MIFENTCKSDKKKQKNKQNMTKLRKLLSLKQNLAKKIN